MSLLDRVTKAVGDAVDRGKKEVDQFVRIQKINSQIGDIERKIGQFKGQIQQEKVKAGEVALEMVRAGTLSVPEIRAQLDLITGIEQQIAAEQTAIAEKKAEIEKIKAESKGEAAPAAAPATAQAEPTPPPPPPAAEAPSAKFCPQCGTQSTGGAFCGSCGTRLA